MRPSPLRPVDAVALVIAGAINLCLWAWAWWLDRRGAP